MATAAAIARGQVHSPRGGRVSCESVFCVVALRFEWGLDQGAQDPVPDPAPPCALTWGVLGDDCSE